MDVVLDTTTAEFAADLDVAWALVGAVQAGNTTYLPALSRVVSDCAGDPHRQTRLLHALISIAAGAASALDVTCPGGVDDMLRRARIRAVS